MVFKPLAATLATGNFEAHS